MPLPSGDLDRPLRDLTQPPPVAAGTPLLEQAHLREYMRLVAKRRWLILSLMVVVTSLTAIQMYRLPDIYEAETQIQIEPKQNVLQTREVVINSGQRDPTYWMTQIKLIQNPQLAREVVLALNLQDDPRFLGGQAGSSVATSVRRIFAGGADPSAGKRRGVSVVTEDEADSENLSPEQLARLEPYEDAVRGGLTVEALEKTSLVYLKYRHTNPEMAARVANTLAEVFIERDIRRERAGAERASELLARQIVDLQNKIKQKEEERIAYLKSRNLPFSEQKGGNLTVERLAIISGQLLAAEQERKSLQSSNETAKSETDIWSVPEVQSDQRIQRLRDKIGELEEQKEALLVQYTAEWPAVRKVEAQIKKLKSNLDRAPIESLKALDSRYQAALKREGKLREAYYQEKGAANEQILDQIDLGRLNQELETDKQYYNTMFQRQKELQITSYDQSNNVSIATPARVPRGPVGPKRMRNIVLALLLSLGAGIGLAFLLDYLDDTLKSIEDVDRYIHLPTLALIPAPRSERLLTKVKGGAANEPSETTALALVDDVRSPAAEAYRHLRTSLLL
ncbi:MAG: GumC family protein, partial [Pyrinomonadaceae bacterium]|nr:GumC family protein [Pyrinomonadaceae bacterium]